MKDGLYRVSLRISSLVTALTLVFVSGILTPITKELSNSTFEYLASAAVGVQVGVEETELSQLTAEFTTRTRALDAREAALQEREIAARSFGANTNNDDYATYIISVILFILTTLMMMNYVLDWRRARESRLVTQVV